MKSKPIQINWYEVNKNNGIEGSSHKWSAEELNKNHEHVAEVRRLQHAGMNHDQIEAHMSMWNKEYDNKSLPNQVSINKTHESVNTIRE